MFTMSEASKEKTYREAEIKARLEQELPRWVYEGGWIRRTYKTGSWKGTLMVINTVGHLAEAAWHHPDITASYAWVEVRLITHTAKGITSKDLELAKKIEEVVHWQPGKEGRGLEGTPAGDARFACIIALGSNLGDKTSNIDRAIELLTEPGDIRLVRRSRNFATDPWGKLD